jgi:hypothetical protein
LTFSATPADTQKAKTGRVSGNVRTINKDTAEVMMLALHSLQTTDCSKALQFFVDMDLDP